MGEIHKVWRPIGFLLVVQDVEPQTRVARGSHHSRQIPQTSKEFYPLHFLQQECRKHQVRKLTREFHNVSIEAPTQSGIPYIFLLFGKYIRNQSSILHQHSQPKVFRIHPAWLVSYVQQSRRMHITKACDCGWKLGLDSVTRHQLKIRYPIEKQALGARSAQSRQTNESKHGMAV